MMRGHPAVMGFQDFEAHLWILFNLMAQSWGTFSQAWENPSSKVSREDFIDKKNPKHSQ